MHNANPTNTGGNIGSAGPTGYQQFDEQDPKYKLTVAKEKKKGWITWIKIIAYILMVLGAISLAMNIFELFGKLGSIGSAPSAVSSTGGSIAFGSQVQLSGLPDVTNKIIDIITSCLIIYQGWLSLKTTEKDSVDAIKKMRRNIIIFAILHVVFRIAQMAIIVLISVVYSNLDDKIELDAENSLDTNTVIFTFVGITAVMTCCCVFCYCGMIYMAHGRYKKAQESYETAEKNVNTGAKAPEIDYSQRQNKMF